MFTFGLKLFFLVWAPQFQWRELLMLQDTIIFLTTVCFQLCGTRPFPVSTWQTPCAQSQVDKELVCAIFTVSCEQPWLAQSPDLILWDKLDSRLWARLYQRSASLWLNGNKCLQLGSKLLLKSFREEWRLLELQIDTHVMMFCLGVLILLAIYRVCTNSRVYSW